MDKDTKFIKRCIELSKKSVEQKEAPFGSVVTINGKIIAESQNLVIQKKDITQHAEMRAILQAERKLKSFDLSKCTLYTNCEPCPMCSFLIRELKFKKVVYSLKSPYMGGHTKWNILEDPELEKFSPVFGKPPIVKSGLLEKEALKVFHDAGWGKMLKK